jgi:hypothetical protein
MSKIAKVIDTEGYSLKDLLNTGDEQIGGSAQSNDLQIPLGLYYDEQIVYDFYKVVKSSVIEDDLFDKLFDMVSKTKSKSTRKNIPKPNKTTRRQH